MAYRYFFLFLVSLLCNGLIMAKPPKKSGRAATNFKAACTTAQAQTDLNINNVRARLLTGGDLWWNRSNNDGKYVVPKPAPGQPEVSAIFAAGIWLGGFDAGGNMKMACQQYGNSQGNSDFWPGPLSVDEGTTDAATCNNWDRHFEVKGTDIKEHLTKWTQAQGGLGTYTTADIPASIKGWPGRGNPFFEGVHGFALPNNTYNLAEYFDQNWDNVYNPLDGDFPYLDLQNCEEPSYPDQMIFWVYNDEGGGAIHGETNGTPIRMEVHATAFAYSTTDAMNDMTFYQHKFINRAKEDLDSFYFGLWVDPSLGCFVDDYIGFDKTRSFAFYYNEDAFDGQQGFDCNGIPTYGEYIPALGIDIFRGPRDEDGNELATSSFIYYNHGWIDNPPYTSTPNAEIEYYRYLSGSFRDGTPLSYGGDGYDPTSTNLTKFAFPSPPNDPDGWSMCYPGPDYPNGLSDYLRATIQSFGPMILQPGARNLLTFGVIFAPNIDYPCPDLTRLFAADDLAQAFFECQPDFFGYGPDAPDVDWIAGDEEITLILTNGEYSNNKEEDFRRSVPEALMESQDQNYNFEGYMVYQMAGPDVGFKDLADTTKARLVLQCDKENGFATVTNWRAEKNPAYQSAPGIEQFIHFPDEVIYGENKGIQRTISIKENLFGKGSDRRLYNHCTYYYLAVAYAANNYLTFDPVTGVGQRKMFIVGSGNVGRIGVGPSYPIMPRPTQTGLLDKVQVVPNPYYYHSGYGDEKGNGYLKITNLPPQCEVNIYSLSGNLVRHFNRNEQPLPPFGSGVEALQSYPDLDWDLNNADGVPIASGVYIIHIRAKGAGEKTLKAVVI
ncbi:MAG: hypothetical protein IPN76_15945 [Saprospiraceae bacterium]|nr:hypothetical protein [Saprospiraceae bacterium]